MNYSEGMRLLLANIKARKKQEKIDTMAAFQNWGDKDHRYNIRNLFAIANSYDIVVGPDVYV